MSAGDEKFMQIALGLGRRNLGNTAENPSVGCVIVAGAGGGAHVVGRGWTARGGRPHAETAALERAGAKAAGATAYVTLEPCAHTGRTPPCADALVDAGIARVVVAAADPDPRVGGRGLERLREAGVAVDTGTLADEARRDLAGFLSRIERGRPEVTLKLAVSADGKIASAPGKTTAITGAAAKSRGHLIRARSDAILVGRGTVLADDPSLTCRLPGLEERSPVRVVLDTALAIPLDSTLVATAADVPVWVFCVEGPPEDKAQALAKAGVEVVPIDKDAAGRPDIGAVLRHLAGRGINTVMVEGGAEIARTLVAGDLVDRVALFRSSATVGVEGVDALGDIPLDAIVSPPQFAAAGSEACGEDRLDWYARNE